MASTDGALRPVRLVEDRLAACLALSTEAAWNQISADWRFMLRHGQGFGLCDGDGTLVGSALVLPHGSQIAWISMVLVTAAWRGRGLATRLLEACIAQCRRTGHIPLLDATPAGAAVYRKLGFRTVDRLTRWHGTNPAPAQPTVTRQVRPLCERDLDAVVAMDACTLSADRPALLQHLWNRAPQAAFWAESDGSRANGFGADGFGADGAGFVLARDGRTAWHIGPLIAPDGGTATALFAAALGAVGSASGGAVPVLVDHRDDAAMPASVLQDCGFVPQRSFERMVLMSVGPLPDGNPASIVAIAGPELG